MVFRANIPVPTLLHPWKVPVAISASSLCSWNVLLSLTGGQRSSCWVGNLLGNCVLAFRSGLF